MALKTEPYLHMVITNNYTYSQEAGAEMSYNVVTEKSRFHEQIFELVVERKLHTYNVTMLTEANNIITIQQLEQPSSDMLPTSFPTAVFRVNTE